MILLALLVTLAPVAHPCHDGDTCRFVVRGVVERVRLLGLDAPEIAPRARCPAEQALAVRARDRLLTLLRGAARVELQPSRSGWIRDKWARLLARVEADGVDVVRVLIAEGLARPYPGGARRGWCNQSANQ